MQITQERGNTMSYLYAGIAMAVIGTVASGLVLWLHPGSAQEKLTYVLAIFAFLTPTTMSLLSYMKAQETHLSVNSQLDKWIKGAQENAHTRGLIEGQAHESNRAGDRAERHADQQDVEMRQREKVSELTHAGMHVDNVRRLKAILDILEVKL